MQKKALLALLLGLTLILSGCTLIQKDPEVDAATEIVRMGDSVVTKGEFQKEVDDELNYMAYMYSMYGYAYDATSAENVKALELLKGAIPNEAVSCDAIGMAADPGNLVLGSKQQRSHDGRDHAR